MITMLVQYVQTLAGSDEGATALEYAALVVGIIVLLLVGTLAFGQDLQTFFSTLFPDVIAGP